MAVPDLAILKRPSRQARLAFATGPIHVPKTFSPTFASVRAPGTATFPPIARMGPPLRACTVGESVVYYGGNSFVRGGGPATGHVWNVYHYDVGTDNGYLANRGAEITDAQITLLDAGKTLQFTPTDAGVYAIELHLDDEVAGDNLFTPFGGGIRFLKVFGVGGFDLEGIPEINGPNGSLDEGGVTIGLSYQRPDNLSGRQTVDPNMRVVINKRFYYYNVATDTWDEYTWEPSGTFDLSYYYSEVLFSGLILGSTIEEDARKHQISYQLAGPQSALQLAQVPTVTVDTSDPDHANYGTTLITPSFYEPAIWELSITIDPSTGETNAEETKGWILLVADLHAEDSTYALVASYSNIATFFDCALYQSDTDSVRVTETRAGSLWDQIKALEGGRFARLFTDRHGIIYTGPDHDLRPDAFRPAPVIALDGDLYHSIKVTHQQALVGQVHVKSADTLLPANQQIAVAPGSALRPETMQLLQTATYEAVYPGTATAGARRHYDAARFFDQNAIDALAQALYSRDNAAFPAIELEVGLFPHLDLNQPVTIPFVPRTQEPAAQWNAGAGGTPLPAYVTSYSNRVDPSTGHWESRYTLREATG